MIPFDSVPFDYLRSCEASGRVADRTLPRYRDTVRWPLSLVNQIQSLCPLPAVRASLPHSLGCVLGPTGLESSPGVLPRLGDDRHRPPHALWLHPQGRLRATQCVFILTYSLGYSGRGFINLISQMGKLRLIEAK